MDTTSARSRRQARERAVELAYEAELRDWTVDQLVDSLAIAPNGFVVELLRRAEQYRDEAEGLIDAKSEGWPIARMPVLDRLVMTMATAELLHADTPTGVVLSEAVELVGRYSTDESSRFVNGVLAAVAREVRPT